MTQQQPKFFRPQWTCGRYNAEADTAIMYNLIEGQSYFFESYSAQVIREILSVPRKEELNIETISANTGIARENIFEFMNVLYGEGLVCNWIFSKGEIRAIQMHKSLSLTEQNQQYDFKNIGQIGFSTAEEAYTSSLNLKTCIPSLMMELTYNCSEKCIHCYNAGATRNDCEISKRNRDELTLEDYKRIIDELYELGTYKVCLTGGDPFSKPIVWDIIDYLYQKDIALDIFTNGQSITNDVERLADYFPRFIGLSIYSAIPEIHDKITRIKGSFVKTIAVAEQLSKLAIPMSFKCVIFKTNVKSYHTVKELAQNYNAILQLEVNLCNGVDGDTSITNHLRLPKKVLEILLRDPNVPMYVGKERKNYGREEKPLSAYPCKAGIENLNITPDGMVTPCCTFPMSLGNVKMQPLKDILNSEPILQWRKTKIENIEECGRYPKCEYCYLCCGNNYLEYGTPLKPSKVSCYMAEIRYELAQKLEKGEDPLQGLSVVERLSQMEIEEVGLFSKEIQKH